MKLSPDATGVQPWQPLSFEAGEAPRPDSQIVNDVANQGPRHLPEAGRPASTLPAEGIESKILAEPGGPRPTSPSGQDCGCKPLEALLEIFQAPSSAQRESSATITPWAPEVLAAAAPRKTARKIVEAFPLRAGEPCQPEAEPMPDPRILAQQEAGRMIADANAQAAEIIALAERQCAEALDQSRRAGLEAAREELRANLQAAAALVGQVNDWRDAMLAQSEPLVLEMIREIAGTLFGQGISLSQDVLQQTFDRALQHAGTLGDLQIFMHPEDAMTIDPYWREYHASLSGHAVKIVPTEAISRGGCYVQGQLGSVDARVETQLRAILEELTPSSAEVAA